MKTVLCQNVETLCKGGTLCNLNFITLSMHDIKLVQKTPRAKISAL
jgi:hypothetical protein